MSGVWVTRRCDRGCNWIVNHSELLDAAARTRRQLATYMRVERITGNRSARASIYAEARRTLALEARWYIDEARHIRTERKG